LNADPLDPEQQPSKAGGSGGREIRTCGTCGTKFSVTSDIGICPVCILLGSFGEESASAGSLIAASGSKVGSAETEHLSTVRRFEHYEVMLDEEGMAIELGRGAMGVTYKAFDVDLCIPVTLKLISEKYVGDESARLRFLREARAAAKVRHSNVASVFHLGRSSQGYFYAMEFVEGETLENLIKRSSRLEVKLTLEILSQVAAGLAAVHKQKLVHRDIKPSNIMVSLEGGVVTAKMIDLGLAKSLDGSVAQTAISTPGAFAGTPEFASPEQFAGVPVDIRSDLYSLGVVLWEMLTGRVPFKGSVAEIMYQHLHIRPPVELLRDTPRPVTVLLEKLLAKDPTKRFQTPSELLYAMSTVKGEIEVNRAIKSQDIRTASSRRGISRAERSQTNRVPKRSIAVLPFDTLSHANGNTYFADGVQDEILSNLAKVSQLKVISRTSVMTFRPEGNRNLRSIAESLGVANVVEGTVRKDGKRVRLTIRLVDARTDETLWSESYDRNLTDIFSIQSEIAVNVAARLSAQLTSGERRDIAEKPTANLEAYDLYLQAKQLMNLALVGSWSSEKEAFSKAANLLEQATQRDPEFALAYCRMADAHGLLYEQRIDHTPERRALSDAAMNEAMRLRPDLAEVHLAMAWHLWDCYRDIERARVQIAIATKALPNNPDLLHLAAVLDRTEGRWDQARAGLERAARLNPRSPDLLHSLAWTYRNMRRYRDSARILDLLIATVPDQKVMLIERAECTFYEKADLKSVRAAFMALPPSIRADPDVSSYQVYYAMCARDFAVAKEILDKAPNQEFFWHETLIPLQILAPWMEFLRGNNPTVEKFGAVREQLNRKIEKEPSEPYLRMALALTDVALGRGVQGIEEGRRAMAMRPISVDAVDGPMVAANFALVCAWADHPDLAFEQLNILIEIPGWFLNYGNLKTYPGWDPLRKDPRFKKLLARLAPNESLQKTSSSASRVRTNKRSVKSGP
jgi:serine/threonine protein kinase/Tfp pilus assembly protein PilF